MLTIKPEYSYACNCSEESSVSDAVKSSNIVFKGVVLSKTTTTDLLKYGVNIIGNSNSSSYTKMLANTAQELHITQKMRKEQ